jgi:hypothetical protein
VPPVGSDLLDKVTLPLRYIIGAARIAFVLVLLVVYLVIVKALCLILVSHSLFSFLSITYPTRYQSRPCVVLSRISLRRLSRVVYYWCWGSSGFRLSKWQGKKGAYLSTFTPFNLHHILVIRRGQQNSLPWNPRAGDIIVSNWVSWIELLWLAFRCVYQCWSLATFQMDIP